MTTDRADYGSGMSTSRPASMEELFQDVPVQTARDLAFDGIFDTDDELEEFVAHVRHIRSTDLS